MSEREMANCYLYMKMRTKVETTKITALLIVILSRFFCTICVPDTPPRDPPPKALESPPPRPECKRTKTVMDKLDMKNSASMAYFRTSI
jgi:hypothetical protein